MEPRVPYLRQNARRCHPYRSTQLRGSALKVPTKHVLKATPFHPLWRRLFTGNRSKTRRTSENPSTVWRNSPSLYFLSTGASSCSRSTFISFERAFSHDTRL